MLKSNPAKVAGLFDFAYGAPESPVLPLVGVAGDQITRVESFRKLGLALLNGSKGDEPLALALDFSPYWLLSRGAVSLQDYRGFSAGQSAVARAKGAVAISEGEAGKTPSSIVFSLSSKFLGAQDPLKDTTFETCIKGTANTPAPFWRLADQVEAAGMAGVLAVPANRPDLANAAFDEAVAAKAKELKPHLEAAYKSCADEVSKLLAQRASLDAGGGFRLNGEPGKLKDLKDSGVVLWTTYATGVVGGGRNDPFSASLPTMSVRGVLHARYTVAEAAFDSTGVRKGSADSGMVVAGLENAPDAEGDDRIRWNLQAGWNRQGSADPSIKTKDYWRYLAIAQVKAADRLWLKATVGRVEGRGVESDTYILVGVSFTPTWSASAIEGLYGKPRY